MSSSWFDVFYPSINTSAGTLIVKTYALAPDCKTRYYWEVRDVQEFLFSNTNDHESEATAYGLSSRWLHDRVATWKYWFYENGISSHLLLARSRKRKMCDPEVPSVDRLQFDEITVSTYGLLFLLAKLSLDKPSDPGCGQVLRAKAALEGIVRHFCGGDWELKLKLDTTVQAASSHFPSTVAEHTRFCMDNFILYKSEFRTARSSTSNGFARRLRALLIGYGDKHHMDIVYFLRA